jgi:membrane protease YdiL (CAAX protease family)
VLGAPRGGIMTLIFVPLGFALAALLYQFARVAIATNIAAPIGRGVVENELTLLASNDKWVVIVGAIVAAPLVEELILRGLLLPALTHSRLRFIGAAMVTTLLFVIMHPGGLAKFASVSVLLDWHLIMSLGLCVTWWLARSVWPCVLAHAASNMVLLGMVLLRL